MHPSQDELRQLFSYDEHTGVLTRKYGRQGNGTVNPGNGYRQLSYQNRTRLEHRIIWMLVYGTWPKMIDHVNGNRADNRLCNLRVATAAQNIWNNIRPRKQAPYRGVFKKSRLYYAQITHLGVKNPIGAFPCAFAAAVAFRNKERELRGSFVRGV